MLRFFQPEKTNDNHYTLLINDLHQTAQDLQDAYRNLENVIDPDLIDCYIYELNSVQMRYKFLLTSIRNYELRTQKNPRGFLYQKSSGTIGILTSLHQIVTSVSIPGIHLLRIFHKRLRMILLRAAWHKAVIELFHEAAGILGICQISLVERLCDRISAEHIDSL